MLVDEEADPVDGARTVEPPEVLERLGTGRAMLERGLRVRADDLPVGVEDAHGVGDDVEDRLELGDAAGEVLAQLLAIGDVGADEEQPPSFPGAALAGATTVNITSIIRSAPTRGRKATRCGIIGVPADDPVDQVVEVGERVRERVVDRAADGADGIGAGEVAIALVRAQQPQLLVEERDGEGDVLEHRVEARQLRAQPVIFTRRHVVVERVSHTSHASHALRVAPRIVRAE